MQTEPESMPVPTPVAPSSVDAHNASADSDGDALSSTAAIPEALSGDTSDSQTAAQPAAPIPDGQTVETSPSLPEQTINQTLPLLQVIEAILFSSDVPLTAGKLAETVGLDSSKPVKLAIAELNAGYEARRAPYRAEERAGGYQLLTLPQYSQYIERLVRRKDEGRLTPASLETLAIIAYKQPILRVNVESIRGVSCGEVIRSLMEHNLVKIVGRAEEIGRPMLYGTTRYFLEVFGLANLRDLPKSEQLKEPV